MNQFIYGATVMACFVVGLFFLRFWTRTRDRLFAIFAIAFWVFGVNWLALAFIQVDEFRTAVYIIRLLAFVFILAGIIDKNRSASERKAETFSSVEK
jgi:hypothetical protein